MPGYKLASNTKTALTPWIFRHLTISFLLQFGHYL
jgi:hypothetical protein